MVSYGISGLKPINLPPEFDAGGTARKPLKPLCTIHIVVLSCIIHYSKATKKTENILGPFSYNPDY